MPYKIVWEEKGVYIKLTGHIEHEEFLNVNYFLYGQKEFDTLEYQLWDFLAIDSASNFGIENVAVISTLDKSSMHWNNKMKVAVVTTNSQIFDFATTYKLDTLNTDWECSIFKEIEEARTWLNTKE